MAAVARVAEPAPAGPATRRADGPRLVVQAWLGTRLLLILVALLVARTSGRTALDLLANWDVQHFFGIARNGYAAANDIAFFPGWPLLLRAGSSLGLPLLWVGVGLALAGSAAAAAALYRLGGTVAAVAWLLVPTTVFTAVPYTESAFCAAAFWAWERALRGRWAAAAGLAALACSVRVSGVFLVVALAVLALTGRFGRGARPAGERPAWPARWRALAWLGVPAVTLGAYLLFLFLTTGSWTAWYDAQASGWARGLTWPWDSFANTYAAATSTAYPAFPEWSWVFRAEIVSMAVGLGVTVACLVRRRWAEATWVGLQVVVFSFSYWFFSVNRAVLLWFPLFLLLAEGTGARWWDAVSWRRVLRVVLLALAIGAAVLALLGWAWLFFTGRWAS